MKEDFNELLNMICPENDIFGCFEIAIDPPTMQEDEGDLESCHPARSPDGGRRRAHSEGWRRGEEEGDGS